VSNFREVLADIICEWLEERSAKEFLAVAGDFENRLKEAGFTMQYREPLPSSPAGPLVYALSWGAFVPHAKHDVVVTEEFGRGLGTAHNGADLEVPR
jgi:hypothetical protein